MRVGGLVLVRELDVFELGPPDHELLLRDGQGLPRAHVVEVLLHVHVAAAAVGGVLVTHDRGRERVLVLRVRGAVHETQQIAFVEELEALNLVHHVHVRAQSLHEVLGQLEAHVLGGRAQVDQQVPRGGHGCVHGTHDLRERVQVLGAGRVVEPIPRIGADTHHAQQVTRGDAERDRLGEVRDVREDVRDLRLRSLLDGQDQEHRGLGRGGHDLLSGHGLSVGGRCATRMLTRPGRTERGRSGVGGCAVLPTLALRYRPAAVGHSPRKSSTTSAALVSRHAPNPVPAHRFSPSASPADAARSGAVM